MIIVSACLAGQKCNYRGADTPCPEVKKMVDKGEAIAVCPEVLAGLPTPRESCEQKNKKVVTQDGKDMTDLFRVGTKKALEVARQYNCDVAILKSYSPSCGSGEVYDGSFTHTIIPGDGVFAKELKEAGIQVYTEKVAKNIRFQK